MSVRALAVATGYSVATVSRALRDDPKVGAATRKSIAAAAEKMGYQSNPYVGQMMSSLRRRRGSTFHGNMAIVFRSGTSGMITDLRAQQCLEGMRKRAGELGYILDEFDLTNFQPKALQRIISHRGIRGILAYTPSFFGAKVRFPLALDSFASVAYGWGLWYPQLDCVRADFFQMIRIALHHACHRFQEKVMAIWDMKTDQTAHGAARAAFLAHHPAGPAAASKLFLPSQNLTEAAFAKTVKKTGAECLLLTSSLTPPSWLSQYIPEEQWIWFRDPGAVPHFGRIDPQNALGGRWAVNLLAAKIQMNQMGMAPDCQNVMVPPRWIPGK